MYEEGKVHQRECFCQEGKMKTEWVPALVRESQTNSVDKHPPSDFILHAFPKRMPTWAWF